MKHEIRTEIVGGVLTKPWPRKDIDIFCEFLKEIEGSFDSRLERAQSTFGMLLQIAERAVQRSQGRFNLEGNTAPYMDLESGDPNIINPAGVIQIRTSKGTLIELLNGSG